MKHCLFLILLTFACAINSFPQSKPDLLKKISSATKITTKNKFTLELADVYDIEGNDSCFILANQVLNWAIKTKNTRWKFNAYEKLGSYNYYRDKLPESEKIFTTCISLAKKLRDENSLTSSYTNLSKVLSMMGKPNEAIKWINKSIAIDRKTKNYAGLTSSVNSLAVIYGDTGNNLKAIQYHKEALSYAMITKDSSDIALIYNDLGLASYNLGRLHAALKYYHQSLEIGLKLKDDKYKSAAYTNLGMVYDQLKMYEKAITFYKKTLVLSQKAHDEYGEAKMWNNIGFVYLNKNMPDSAKIYFERSMKLKEHLDIPNSIAMTTHNLGKVYFMKKQYDKAMEYYKKAREIYLQTGDSVGLAATMNYYGLVCLEKKDYAGAIKHLKESLELSKKLQFLESLAEGHRSLSDAYKGLNDYKNAYENYVKFFTFNDSMLNDRISQQIAEMDAVYESSEKEKRIAVLNEEAKVKNAVLEKQDADAKRKRAWIVVFASILVFVLLLLVVFIRNNRQKKRANKLLTHQKHLIEEKNKEILDSINYAKRLQDAILPPRKLVTAYLENSFILYLPKDIVAGDFYWMEVVESPGGKLVLFAAADCTGHGVPGAMVSVVCATALNRAVKEFRITQPSAILDKVRSLVIETFERSENEVKDGMDISLCALNMATGQMSWAGANNPLWIVRHSANEIEEIQGDRQPVGKHSIQNRFTHHQTMLGKGDQVYIFTDGYADQFGGEKGKKFKPANLKKVILEMAGKDIQLQEKNLLNHFENWKGNFEQLDDVCIVGLRF